LRHTHFAACRRSRKPTPPTATFRRLDLSSHQAAVAFDTTPAFTWDIDVTVGSIGMPLPSWLENRLTPFIAEQVLAYYSLSSPLLVPLA
jgi:hypothetical protein